MIIAGGSTIRNAYSGDPVGGYHPEPEIITGSDGQVLIIPMRVILANPNNFAIRKGLQRVIPAAGIAPKPPVGGTVISGYFFGVTSTTGTTGNGFNVYLTNQTPYSISGTRFTWNNGVGGDLVGSGTVAAGASAQLVMSLVVGSANAWHLMFDGTTILSAASFSHDVTVMVTAGIGN